MGSPLEYTRPPRGLPRYISSLDLLSYVHNRRTYLVGSVWIKLSTSVVWGQVQEGLIQERDNLDIRFRLEKLDTGYGIDWDNPRPPSGLRTPSNFYALGLADGSRAFGRCPDAPVIDMVDEGGLALGTWAFGSRVASVIA